MTEIIPFWKLYNFSYSFLIKGKERKFPISKKKEQFVLLEKDTFIQTPLICLPFLTTIHAIFWAGYLSVEFKQNSSQAKVSFQPENTCVIAFVMQNTLSVRGIQNDNNNKTFISPRI